MKKLLLALMTIGSAAAADVPLTRASTGHVTVPVSVNGEGPFAFVIDTGAQATAVYAPFAATHRLPVRGRPAKLTGQTGEASVSLVTIDRLAVDGTDARHLAAVRLEPRRDGGVLAGILGLDVMGDRLVEIDFRAGRAALHGSAAADRVAARLGTPVRAQRLAGGLLAIPVTVNGVAGTAVIDTGARETRVNGAFARAAGLAVDPGKRTTIYGATNTALELSAATARSVGFAGMTLADRPIRVGNLPVFAALGLASRPAMLLGADYLGDRRLVIDFRDGRVWVR